MVWSEADAMNDSSSALSSSQSDSLDQGRKKIWHKRGLVPLTAWAVLGFLAAQSFTLSPITGYICLVPLTVALYNFQIDIAWRNSLLLLALFWSTDHAVLNYGATIAPIRYLIYITVVASFFHASAVTLSRLLAVCFAGLCYLAITIIGTEQISTTQLLRDLQLMLLVGLLFALKAKRPFRMDMQLLTVAMTAYLFSECINFFVLRPVWLGDYMRYSSTKYLIVLPSLLALLARRTVPAFLLLAITIPVLVGYTTRTLFLSYLLIVLCIILFFSISGASGKRATALTLGVLGLALFEQFDTLSFFESFKATRALVNLDFQLANALRVLDPVRYASSALLFDLSPLEVLFGRGFGSGVHDEFGLFAFVSPDQAAFTIEELNASYFYNFHDVWVDVGLRFGLLPFGAFLFWFARQRPRQDRGGVALWLLVFIGILSAFYSIQGLLSIFLLIRVVTSYRAN